VSEGKGRILVIRGGAIGDFILTLPVLAALRSQFPAVSVEVLGYAHIAQLARVGGLADVVRSIEARALASFFARNGSLPEDMQDYFARFALILSFLYDPDGIFR
jgi:heptosyltransferase-2